MNNIIKVMKPMDQLITFLFGKLMLEKYFSKIQFPNANNIIATKKEKIISVLFVRRK